MTSDETRLVAIRQKAQHWLESSPEVPYDAEKETALDVQHHNDGYEIVEVLLTQLDAQAQTIATLTQERDEACKNSEWLDVRRDRLEARLTQLTEGLTKLKAVLSSDCNYGDSCAAGEAEPLVDALLADPPTTPAR